jgi:hypothetical protein
MSQSYGPGGAVLPNEPATYDVQALLDRRGPHPGHVALVCSWLGLRVFPFRFLDNGDKKPSIRRWQDRAVSDYYDIDLIWRDGGTHGKEHSVGVLTGAGTNPVWVLDLDCKNGVDGFAALAALEAEHGPLPSTFTVRTPTGGEHRYWRWPADGREVHSSTGALGAGIDVRGWHGFVVAPLTVRTFPGRPPRTGRYDVIDTTAWVDAPSWLLDRAIEAGYTSLARGTSDPDGHGDPISFDTWAAEAVTIGGPNSSAATSQQWYLFRGLCSMRARDLSRDDMLRLGWAAASRFTTYDAARPWTERDVIEKVDYVRGKYPPGTPLDDLARLARQIYTSYGGRP